MSLAAASSALRRYQLDLHCAGFETALLRHGLDKCQYHVAIVGETEAGGPLPSRCYRARQRQSGHAQPGQSNPSGWFWRARASTPVTLACWPLSAPTTAFKASQPAAGWLYCSMPSGRRLLIYDSSEVLSLHVMMACPRCGTIEDTCPDLSPIRALIYRA